jgi:hypothetical protein
MGKNKKHVNQLEFNCPFTNNDTEKCQKSFDNVISLCKHWKRSHKPLDGQNLYNILNDIKSDPACACGCTEKTRFLGIERGYREYIRGHASRVNNNWGHNEKALSKSQKKRKAMIKDGAYVPFVYKVTGKHWNTGLTKETDTRLAKMSEYFKSNQKLRKEYSNRMREGRLSGKIPTVRGKDSGAWKGGISSVSGVSAVSTKLYKEWKFPILKSTGFSCLHCGTKKSKLHVHHDKERMADIVREVASKHGWFERISTNPHKSGFNEELESLKHRIAEAVADYHVLNNVSGMPLCRSCHKEEHRRLKENSCTNLF